MDKVVTFLCLAASNLSSAIAAPTVLSCNLTKILSDEMVQMSVILEEDISTVTVNGQRFANAHFEPYRVRVVARSPDVRVAGISRETSFRLDRVTGNISLITGPVVTDNSMPTEEQKAKLNRLPTDASFIGSCVPGKVKF